MALPVEILRALMEAGASPEAILAAAEDWEARERRDRDEAVEAEALLRRLVGSIRPAVRKEVIERDGLVCTYCGRAVLVAHLDHVVPRVRGGLSVAENLVVSCKPCNSSKKDRPLEEWAR